MPVIACPRCGEDEQIQGRPTPDGISITCEVCEAVWLRNGDRQCATCGGSSIVIRPMTLTQYSRGTQLSVVGWRDTPLCTSCDADALAKSVASAAPIAAGYQPAALHKRTDS